MRNRTLNEKGYVRFFAAPHRNRYEHRVVMAEASSEFCFYPLNPRSGLPDGFHVEHIDHCKTHNCISNLLLIQDSIHNWTSWHSMRKLSRVEAFAEMIENMKLQAQREAV